jgi:hypothetical protein
MGKQGMVDEESLCMKRCTHASVRRMDLQILCSKALSRLALLADLVGIWIERSDGLQWLLITYAHTYVTVLLSIGTKAVE